MAVEGDVTIEIKAKTDKFDRQIAELEKKMKKQEDKKMTLDVKMKMRTDELDNARQKYKELLKDHKELVNLQNMPHKTVGQIARMQDLQNQYGSVEKLNEKIEQAYTKQEKAKIKVQEIQRQYESINKEVDEYKQKIENVKIQRQVADVEQLKQGFNNVGNSLESSIKKVARLALGIFGLRGAYMALRRASSDLASYDQQYATNLEYIRYALAQAVAPVLRYIVELAAKVLQYINMILNALFGINIFSRGSAESFNKMKTGASGVSKAVKEIKKQLAGFDEITMLTDQSDTGTAGGAGGVGMPSFDLSTFNIKQPKWLDWLVKNKKNILSLLGGIAGFLVTFKLGLGALLSLGVGVALYGIIESVQGLLAFIKNPTWENFKKFLGGLAVAITGVAIAMIAFNATNPVGWILLAVGAVVALTTAIIGLIAKLITNKAKILDTKKAQEELTKAQERAREATDAYVNAVDRAEQAQKELTEAEMKNKLSGEELYQAVQNGTLDYQNMNEAQREVYKAYLNNKSAQEELKNATEELNNAKKEETKASWENQLAIAKEKGNYDEFRDSVVKAYQDGKLSAEEARDYIERAMGDMSDSARQTFTEDLPNDIKDGLDPKKYESAWSRFKTKWNEFWNKLKRKISMYFEVNYSAEGGGTNSYGSGNGGGGFRAKGGIFYPSKLPRLAVGGIINQPGRGIPYHGAVIGERGAEAVVPLTDSQQMELLGQTIGRYITINANIPVNMNGRTISRELKQINAEQEFAYNS